MTSHAPGSAKELAQLLRNDTKVKVAAVDVDGVLRGKMMSKEKFLSAAEHGFGFCSTLFGWDMHDRNYTKELLIANEANGYRDLIATIDLSTFRRLSWEGNVAFFLLNFKDPATGAPLSVDPRSLLGEVTKRASKRGWLCIAGAELEYYQFRETPNSLVEKGFQKLDSLTPGNHGYSMIRPALHAEYFHELYDKALEFETPVEAHHTETGPGVYETALAYTEAGRLADNTVLFKFLAKSVGMKHGIMPTFMAKPFAELPGCSGHIHVSLRGDKGNLFAVSEKRDSSFGLEYISQEAEWFLAGLMDGLADVIVLMCPNVNSYKRLLGGGPMWAPDTASYGWESRKTSIRIISPPSCPPAGTRFEIRIPGADMNAHLALGAIFGLGMRGIELKLALPHGPLGSPGVTRDTVKPLPTSLGAAVAAFASPLSVAREIFGDQVVDHIAGTKQHEMELFERSVTSWEVERYFELS